MDFNLMETIVKIHTDCFDVPTAKFEFKPLDIYSTEQKSKLISMFWAPADEPDAEPVSENPTASSSASRPAVPATSVATGSTAGGAPSSDDVAAPIGVLIEPASW